MFNPALMHCEVEYCCTSPSSITYVKITKIRIYANCYAPDALSAFLTVRGMARPWQLPTTAVVVGPPCREAIDEDNEVHVLCL